MKAKPLKKHRLSWDTFRSFTPCSSGLRFARRCKSAPVGWRECRRSEWMIWLLDRYYTRHCVVLCPVDKLQLSALDAIQFMAQEAKQKCKREQRGATEKVLQTVMKYTKNPSALGLQELKLWLSNFYNKISLMPMAECSARFKRYVYTLSCMTSSLQSLVRSEDYTTALYYLGSVLRRQLWMRSEATYATPEMCKLIRKHCPQPFTR